MAKREEFEPANTVNIVIDDELLAYLKLYNLIAFLNSEEVLTSKTADEMLKALIIFKKYAYKDLQ